MRNSYPHTPPHASFIYFHPLPYPDRLTGTAAIIGAFLPLTWVHTYPEFREQRKAADHFMLTQRTFFPQTLLTYEDIFMAKTNRFVEYEFVNIRLTEEQVEDFQTWAAKNQGNIWRMLTDLAEAGYKHSTSPDPDNQCHISTLTATEHASENNKHCLSSRSDDLIEAVLLSCYKHFVLSDGGEWVGSAARKNWG